MNLDQSALYSAVLRHETRLAFSRVIQLLPSVNCSILTRIEWSGGLHLFRPSTLQDQVCKPVTKCFLERKLFAEGRHAHGNRTAEADQVMIMCSAFSLLPTSFFSAITRQLLILVPDERRRVHARMHLRS